MLPAMTNTAGPVRECHCLVCAPVDDLRGHDVDFQDIAGHIGSHGWSSLGIASEDGVPAWAFTVGLWHSHGAPEVSMFGLRNPDMQNWLNEIGEQVQAGGELNPGDRLVGILPGDFPLLVRPVDTSWYRDLFGAALGFYGRPPLPIVQAVWPDRNGLFPWEDGVGEACASNQPWLWLPRDEHPSGLWRHLDALTPWAFPGLSVRTAVFTTKRINEGAAQVRGIVHEHEGDWQFLDGDPVTAEDGALVHLHHIVAGHPHVAEFADLPSGMQAWRQDDGTWLRSPLST